ncbi:transposase domain-containing protein, partial [Streptomyces sp. ISL-98]
MGPRTGQLTAVAVRCRSRDRVVAECGRSGQRTRLLPPRVVVYFVLAM